MTGTDEPLRVGDRIEWIGDTLGPLHKAPQTGERGWLLMVDPQDDIVAWDDCGTWAGGWATDPNVRRVENPETMSVVACVDHANCALLHIDGRPDVTGDYHALAMDDERPRWVLTRPDGSVTERVIADHHTITVAIAGAVPGAVPGTVAQRIVEIAWPGWSASQRE
jgi:hypothetical protein